MFRPCVTNRTRQRLARLSHTLAASLLVSFSLPSAAHAQEGPVGAREEQPAEMPPKPFGLPNWKTDTFGGLQLWNDHYHRAGWRIQRHVYTQHCRLLDPDDKRHAWGNYEHCRKKLDALQAESPLAAPSGKIVVLVHGLGRTRHSMMPTGEFLEQHGGYHVVNFSYASTRGSLDQHAAALRDVLEELKGAEEISFVAHSLGNIVIRRCLADVDAEWLAARNVKRMVMLAPPNQGAELARRLRRDPLFRHLLGESAQQLAAAWPEIERKLATPSFEFGILAGGEAAPAANNPLIEGPDDLVVSVEETKLTGASDFRVVPVLHTFMPENETVLELTLGFLREGTFPVSEGNP